MIKEMLENYMNYKAQIKDIEKRILELEMQEPCTSSPNLEINGDIRSKGKITDAGKEIDNKVDDIRELEKRKILLQAKVNYIDSIIDTLKHEERKMIRMYFIEKKEMPKLLKEFNRDNETSIYNTISNLIKKMEKCDYE